MESMLQQSFPKPHHNPSRVYISETETPGCGTYSRGPGYTKDIAKSKVLGDGNHEMVTCRPFSTDRNRRMFRWCCPS